MGKAWAAVSVAGKLMSFHRLDANRTSYSLSEVYLWLLFLSIVGRCASFRQLRGTQSDQSFLDAAIRLSQEFEYDFYDWYARYRTSRLFKAIGLSSRTRNERRGD